MLVPVSAILFGHFVLAEELTPREIIGALIICAALAIIDGRVLTLAQAFRHQPVMSGRRKSDFCRPSHSEVSPNGVPSLAHFSA